MLFAMFYSRFYKQYMCQFGFKLIFPCAETGRCDTLTQTGFLMCHRRIPGSPEKRRKICIFIIFSLEK